MKKNVVIFFVLGLASLASFAQALETNVSGLVVKNYRCNLNKWVEGDLINRTDSSFKGSVHVKIIDGDNDIIYQGYESVNVGSQNGVKFSVWLRVGTCNSPNRVQITLDQ